MRVGTGMVVMINGSFGVGKSAVAKLLRKELPGSVIYNPEWAGIALMRLSKWSRLQGSDTDDFQDIVLWRRFTVAGIRLSGVFASGPVLVPMAFTRRDYYDEIIAKLRDSGREVKAFCLRAELPTIRKRLIERGEKLDEPGSEWILRRINECAEAHRDPHFGEPVETDNRTAAETAQFITSVFAKNHPI
jgi:predicted kinase